MSKFAVQVRVPKDESLKEVGIAYECPESSSKTLSYELDKATVYIHTFLTSIEAETFRMLCLTESYKVMGR